MKQFIGTCVGNPFSGVDELNKIVDSGRVISKKRFLSECDVDNCIISEMKRFPYDYQFFKSDEIYFYEWSAIEHFYK